VRRVVVLSHGNLDLQVRAADVPDLRARSAYTTGEDLMNAVADSLNAAGNGNLLNDLDGMYFIVPGRVPSWSCNAYYWRHHVTHVVDRTMGLMIKQEGCAGRTAIGPGPNPAPVDWGGWAQEIGHDLQDAQGRWVIHPAGYGDGYNLMDSCYPCSSGVFDLTGEPIVRGPRSAFPGWLPAAKVFTFGTTSLAQAIDLAAIGLAPNATSSYQGIKVPIDAVDVPVGGAQRWQGDRYYLVESDTRPPARRPAIPAFCCHRPS
jgi:hypothetical protein